MIHDKINVYDYIKQHNHIHYCEAIIYPDGRIADVKPSHIYTLIRETGISYNDIYKKIPVISSPIDWLIEYTGCICVWYEYCVTPKSLTKEQLESLKALIENKIITNKIITNRLNEEEMMSVKKAKMEEK